MMKNINIINKQQSLNVSFKSKKTDNKKSDIESEQEPKEDALDVMANSPQAISAKAQVHKIEAGEDSGQVSDSADFDRDSSVDDMMSFIRYLEGRDESGRGAEIFERMNSLKTNDFSEEEADEFFDEDIDIRFLSNEEIEDVSMSISNPNVKKVFDIIKTSDNIDISERFASCVTDMDKELSCIEDDYVKEYVNNKLENLLTLKGEDCDFDAFFGLEKVVHIVDSYHQLNNNMSPLKTPTFFPNDVVFDDSKSVGFLNELEYRFPRIAANFRNILESDDKNSSKAPLVEDFCNAVRLDSFEAIASEPKISDYLYENYYVNQLNMDDKDKNMLLKINKDLGTKVIMPTYTKNINESLNFIYDELNDWKKASKGKLDLLYISNADRDFVPDDDFGETLGGLQINNMYLKRGDLQFLQENLRHELIHRYDSMGPFYQNVAKDKGTADLINSIMPAKIIKDENGSEKKVLDFDNCKYREEFLKAGINYKHIGYAYTNCKEFIAVAGEGDTTQYSPEFKNILVKLGLPEFAFDLPCRNPKTIDNVEEVKDYISTSGKPLNYDEYANKKTEEERQFYAFMRFLANRAGNEDFKFAGPEDYYEELLDENYNKFDADELSDDDDFLDDDE